MNAMQKISIIFQCAAYLGVSILLLIGLFCYWRWIDLEVAKQAISYVWLVIPFAAISAITIEYLDYGDC